MEPEVGPARPGGAAPTGRVGACGRGFEGSGRREGALCPPHHSGACLHPPQRPKRHSAARPLPLPLVLSLPLEGLSVRVTGGLWA